MSRPDIETKNAAEVSGMFDKIAGRYDLTNDLLTFGIDRLWRIQVVKAVAPRPGEKILDLAAGTGTSSVALAKSGAHVTAGDFSEGMLAVGREKHGDNPLVTFEFADATDLKFADDTFDAATISFGLRNVNDVPKALAEMRRVVKPGGRVVVCEFSTPIPVLRAPYNFYSTKVLPQIAGLVTRDKAAYEYLNESISAWPGQETLAAMLQAAGLENVKYRNLSAGIAAIHRGWVPSEKGGK